MTGRTLPTTMAIVVHLIWAAAATAAEPEVLTLQEAADLLRVDPGIVRELAEGGELPGRRLGGDWRFSRQGLLQWLGGGAPRPAPGPEPRAGLLSSELAAITARGVAATAAQSPPSDTIGEAPTEKSASEVFLRNQLILLAPRELTLDLGAFYGRNDDLVLSGAGATGGLGAVESDTFGLLAVARYSLARDLELFATTSHRRQEVSIFQGGRRTSRASREDLGDIGFGVRRTVQHEDVGRPDIILTLEGAVPTGSGAYAVGGGLDFVKSFDPAILYGSIDYRRLVRRDFSDATQLQPTHRFDATLGYAFALNDTLTLNTSLTGTLTGRSTFGEAVLRQSEAFSLLFGLTTRVSRTIYLQPSVSFRLNGPGNGVVFGLNIPYVFGN
jgi:excisionase family DNA binding protein